MTLAEHIKTIESLRRSQQTARIAFDLLLEKHEANSRVTSAVHKLDPRGIRSAWDGLIDTLNRDWRNVVNDENFKIYGRDPYSRLDIPNEGRAEESNSKPSKGSEKS